MNLRFDQVIASIFEQFVDAHGGNDSPFSKDQGAVFTVRCNYDNFGYENDGNTHHPDWQRSVVQFHHFIILASCRVFYACCEDESGHSIFDWRKIPLDKWQNTSNHSSCWRHDGFMPASIRAEDAQCWVRQGSPKEHRAHALSSFHSFGMGLTGKRAMDFVEVDHVPAQEGGNAMREIQGIRELRARLVLD